MSIAMNEPDTGSVAPVWRLLPIAAKQKGLLIASVVSGLAFHVTMIVASATGAWLVGHATLGGDAASLHPAILLLAIVVAAATLLVWYWMAVVHDFAYALLADLRVGVFESLARLAPRYIYGKRTGDLAATVMSDVEVTERFFAHTIADYVVALVVTVAATVALGFIHPGLAVILPIAALAIATVPFWLARAADRQGRRWRADHGALTADVIDGTQGLRELVAFSQAERYAARIDRKTEALSAAQKDYGRRVGLEAAAGDAIQSIAALAVLGLAAWLVAQGKMEAAVYPMAVVLIVAALIPVAAVTQVARELGEVSASARRLLGILDHPPAIEDKAAGKSAPKPTDWGIRFDHVNFSYGTTAQAALSDASFEIKPGETVVLVGHSGAGKSTCANLLMRLWDVGGGAIRIGGIDLRDWPEAELRRQIAVVPQDAYLFNTSIRDNLRIGRPEARDDEVRAAASAALAHGFITGELPEGYDTVCGERGVELSGGQKQRIAIGRALLKDAPILVMDEAVSNLDAESERALQMAMRNVAKGRTTLLIAHRPSTIRTADRIIVLDGGKVVAAGTHESLIAAGGAYAALFATGSE